MSSDRQGAGPYGVCLLAEWRIRRRLERRWTAGEPDENITAPGRGLRDTGTGPGDGDTSRSSSFFFSEPVAK